ncbi:MAG: STAS domain-containing protein [Planctomycetes bacterium]|nr:STAS domain-containing protein [Planctomycetota bacterium]
MPGYYQTILREVRDGVSILRLKEGTIREGSFLEQAHEDLQEFAEKVGGKVILDFSNLEFISSAGISLILWFSELLRSQGGQLKICEASPDVLDIFKVGKLDTVLPFHDTTDEALAALKDA